MTKDNDLGAQSATAVETAGSIASDAASHVAPVRVQRKRSKGWKMPENTVYVGRPTKFGNPWTPVGYWNAGYSGDHSVAVKACVENFRAWMTRTRSAWSGEIPEGPIKEPGRPMIHYEPPDLSGLRGKNLACWCPLDQPCHADVLLEIANATQPVSEASGSVPSAVQE